MSRLDHLTGRVDALEERVRDLGRQIERVTREPGDPVTPEDREDRVATPTGEELFQRDGVFHIPEPGNEVWATQETFPATGDWRRIRVSLTVEISEWHADEPDGLHGIFWLYRDGRWRGNTIGYVNARGPNKNRLTVLNNIGMEAGETRRAAPIWRPREGRHRLVYDYDSDRGMAVVFDANDGPITRPLPAPGPLAIKESLHLEIGLHAGHVEVPTYGWRYSDLLVEGWRA